MVTSDAWQLPGSEWAVWSANAAAASLLYSKFGELSAFMPHDQSQRCNFCVIQAKSIGKMKPTFYKRGRWNWIYSNGFILWGLFVLYSVFDTVGNHKRSVVSSSTLTEAAKSMQNMKQRRSGCCGWLANGLYLKFPRNLITKPPLYNKSISICVTWLIIPTGQNSTKAVLPCWHSKIFFSCFGNDQCISKPFCWWAPHETITELGQHLKTALILLHHMRKWNCANGISRLDPEAKSSPIIEVRWSPFKVHWWVRSGEVAHCDRARIGIRLLCYVDQVMSPALSTLWSSQGNLCPSHRHL